MGLTLIAPPTAWPLTATEAKSWLRITSDIEDALFELWIRSETAHVERSLGMSLMERTYRLTLDAFNDAIELPRGPVSSVTSVQYVDASGETQTVPTSDYTTDLTSSRQWVVRNSGASWPSTIDAVNAVFVEYVAGFAELPDEYADIKVAIAMLVGVRHKHREGISGGGNAPVEIPLAVEYLLQPYRTVMV